SYGCCVVFTGIGGDELMYLRPPERPCASEDTARQTDPLGIITPACYETAAATPAVTLPPTVVPESALHAIACRAPVFLRAGCWAVNPLCTPELVRFCQWLPPRWRSGKLLHRTALERAGHRREVVPPARRENFTDVMQYGLRRHALRLLVSP